MESQRKRSMSKIKKWCCYALLLLLCAVLQTTPGLLPFGQAKPLFLLPLCLAVACKEDEFAAAIFGMVCGLMWDYTAGRTVGMLALSLMIICFLLSVLVQLYLQCTAVNFVVICTGVSLLVLSMDFLFYYVMPGYSCAAEHYTHVVLPTAALTLPMTLPLLYAVRFIYERFHVDSSVV